MCAAQPPLVGIRACAHDGLGDGSNKTLCLAFFAGGLRLANLASLQNFIKGLCHLCEREAVLKGGLSSLQSLSEPLWSGSTTILDTKTILLERVLFNIWSAEYRIIQQNAIQSTTAVYIYIYVYIYIHISLV